MGLRKESVTETGLKTPLKNDGWGVSEKVGELENNNLQDVYVR